MVKKRVIASVRRSRTRSGCLTCRDRHMKCDEQQPICRNCIKSKRECQRGIRLNFTLMTVSSASLDPPSLARKRSSKASETSDHYTHIFPTTHRYRFLDQSITIASLYEDGITPYEPYLHLHRHEDLCESDRQFQEDTMCQWSSTGLIDRSAAALLPLPLSGKLSVSACPRPNLNPLNPEIIALQSLMVPDYSMMGALRYLTLLNAYPPLDLHTHAQHHVPQSQLPPPHPLTHQLNNFIQPTQHFPVPSHPLVYHQYSAVPHFNETTSRDTHITGQASPSIRDLNNANNFMRVPVMTRGASRMVRYESSLGPLMQKAVPSALNDDGKEQSLSAFEQTAPNETFDLMIGNDSYAMNPALNNFFGAEAANYNNPSASGHLLRRHPNSQFSSGFSENGPSSSLGCDSHMLGPEHLIHNSRLCASPQLPLMSEHSTVSVLSQRRILECPASIVQHNPLVLLDDQIIGDFCQHPTSATPSHLHSPNVIKFCNYVSQSDILLCMDLIENEQYFWLLDLFNGVDIWKNVVPSYCVDGQKDSSDNSMFLLRCLLNCSMQRGVVAELPALTLEQETLWNLVRHEPLNLNNTMTILEELILSVALILLSLYAKHDTKCTAYIKAVLNHQAKLFDALTARLRDSSGMKTSSLLIASGIQLVVILKFMIRHRFDIGTGHSADSASRHSIAGERETPIAQLVPAHMHLTIIKENGTNTPSQDTFDENSSASLQRYQSVGGIGGTELVAITPNQNFSADNQVDCKEPASGADLLYLIPNCYDQGGDVAVSLADFVHVGEFERQGLALLFADLEYVIAETIKSNAPTHRSKAIAESRELRHYFWNMLKSEAANPTYDEAYMPIAHSAWPLRAHEFRSGAVDISEGSDGQPNINERLVLVNLIIEKLRKTTMRGESWRACDRRIKYIFTCIWESLLSEGGKKRWLQEFGWMRD